MKRQVTGALVLAVVAILAAGCGGSGSGGSARITAPGCPAGAPPSAPPGRSAGPGGLIRPDPSVVTLCQYGSGGSGRAALALRITLRHRAAAGLAAVVDSGGPVTRSTRRCDRPGQQLPYPQVLVFAYRPGQVSRVSVTQLSCDRAVLTARGRSAVLGFSVAADLFALSMMSRHPSGPRTPGLIGLRAGDAAAAARRHHFGIYFDGGVIDPAARFGTVVFQSLPAGIRDGGPGHQVDVVLAVREIAALRARSARAELPGRRSGAGNDFGTLLISDRSSRPCTLGGPLRVAGLNRAGHRVTTAVRVPVAGVSVLSPGVGSVTRTSQGPLDGVTPGDLVGMIVLRAEYRDGPARVDNGLCEPLWVVPASWRVTLPGSASLVAANRDRHNRGLVRSGGFVTCRGGLGLAAPATVAYPGS